MNLRLNKKKEISNMKGYVEYKMPIEQMKAILKTRKNKEKIGDNTCFSVFFLDICQTNVIFRNLIYR